MSDVITDIDGYPGGRDALADQYVLGILDEATSELVATAVEVDPDWRGAVVASQERFLPLALTAEPLDLGQVPFGARRQEGLHGLSFGWWAHRPASVSRLSVRYR